MKNKPKCSLLRQTLVGIGLSAACLAMQLPLLAQVPTENATIPAPADASPVPPSSSAESLFQEAVKAQDPTRQADLYRQYLNLKPNDAVALNNLGITLKKQGDYEGAVGSYRKAIQNVPGGDNTRAAKIYNNLGESLRLQNKVPEALEAFNKSLVLDPKLGFAYNNVGKIYFTQNRLEDAITSFQKAVAINPKEAEPQGNLAGALIAAKRYQEASLAARQGVKVDPEDPITRYNLGLALMKQSEALNTLIEQKSPKSQKQLEIELRTATDLSKSLRKQSENELKSAKTLFDKKGDQKNSARVGALLQNLSGGLK
jgi:tetratricopeptide (TPR) repeat protein